MPRKLTPGSPVNTRHDTWLKTALKKPILIPINFHSGNGESWGPQSIERIIERIKKCIDANVAMNDFAIDGVWNEEIVGEFLTYAYEAYEAH